MFALWVYLMLLAGTHPTGLLARACVRPLLVITTTLTAKTKTPCRHVYLGVGKVTVSGVISGSGGS